MKNTKRYITTVTLLVLFIIYLIVLFKITIFRESHAGGLSSNVIPLATIGEYLHSILRGHGITGVYNIFGNLLIFWPLGYIAAALFPKMRRFSRVLLLAMALSIFIEVFQYVSACGRADIDDVILNVCGGGMGYGVYALLSWLWGPQRRAIFVSTLMIALTCLGFYSFNNYRFLIPLSAPGSLPAPGILRSLPALADTNDTSNGQLLIMDRPPRAPLSTDEVAHTVINSGSAASAQSYTGETAWNLIIVNKWNNIPDNYTLELTKLTNGQSVDIRIYPALQAMFDAARSAGVYPTVISGYRSAEEQQRLLDSKIAEYRALGFSADKAKTRAEAYVAVPGTSEHQLGLAVDINADGIRSTGEVVYSWLEQNSYKFGFIRRYPAAKTEITGVMDEPWHFRYIGVDEATKIYQQGICLEEYLQLSPIL